MIKSVKITNYLGESISFELEKPEESGFIVKKIDGLGPAKSSVNISKIATIDGGRFSSALMDTRNIVLDLIFLPNPTIEDTRQLSYKYFPSKKELTFAIYTDNRELEITGIVESNDPEIFAQDQNDLEGCSISILCPNPYFYSIKEYGDDFTTFYGTDPLFEFPFDNNSLTDKLIEFGEVHNRTTGVVTYQGDGEIGVTIRMHAIGPASGISIYNLDKREIMSFNDDKLEALTGSKIIAGDTLVVSTVRGSRYVHLIRDGIESNVLNILEKPISWFQLSKGDNTFAYTAKEGITNLQFAIYNRITYEGV